MSKQEANDSVTELRIAITTGETSGTLSFVFDVTGQDPIGPLLHPWLTVSALNDQLPGIRQLLSTWADAYKQLLANDSESKVKMDSPVLKDMWYELALWGWGAYNQLFDVLARGNENLARMSEDIRRTIPDGSRFIVNSSVGDLPWGLLFDQEPPNKDSENFLDEVRKHFWGLKYQLQATPPSNPRYFQGLSKPVLDNEESTRFTITINENMDGEYKTNHKLFFDQLTNKFELSPLTKPSPLRLNLNKQTVIESLHDRQEPQHLYYFYCHHTKGDGKYTYRGYRNFERSKVIITGNEASDETAIGFGELQTDGAISAFQKPPVVFMNACESAQKDVGNPMGFMFIFAYQMAAYPFIGTEAPIPAAFADDFGRQFIERFLEGQSIGVILLDLKKEFAGINNNPFGLYYSLFGNANTRLLQKVRRSST